MTGKVLWFDKRDENGIIKSDDGHYYYVDISSIDKRESLKAEQRVMFEKNHLITECLCAVNVRLI